MSNDYLNIESMSTKETITFFSSKHFFILNSDLKTIEILIKTKNKLKRKTHQVVFFTRRYFGQVISVVVINF